MAAKMQMQHREKYLAIGLGTAMVLWFGSSFVGDWVLGPFREKNSRLQDLTEQTERLEDEMLLLARARKQFTDWKSASLPPDRKSPTSKRPDALDAQRLYQAWLTNLAHLSGLESASVKPAASRRFGSAGRGASAKAVYVGVVVTIESEGKFAQLCSFLDHFYEARLLQRINKLTIESRESQGDPIMRFSLEAEGLALVDVPWRPTLFPETRLTADLTHQSLNCVVTTSQEFPAKAPFRVRINNEFAQVTAVDGDRWTLARGVDRTTASQHQEGAVVELAPVIPGMTPRTPEQFRELLAGNFFVKPQPPKQYQLQIGPLAQQVLIRGQSLNLTLPVSNFDPTLGSPEFVTTGKVPPGLTLDRGTGRISWTPTAEQPIGLFPIPFEIRHPSAAQGKLAGSVTIQFREPNLPPSVVAPAAPVAFLGRNWALPLEIRDQETPLDRLKISVGNSLAGMTINPQRQQLEWTPPATIAPGDYSVAVTVVDDGTPAQTQTVTIPVTVRDDDAQFTYLVASVAVDGRWQAWFYNRVSDSKTTVRIGDTLQVADIKGEVRDIGKDFILLQTGSQMQRLGLGQNLRELTIVTAARDSEIPGLQ